MSGIGLSLRSRRRSSSDFDPATISAVSAWLRVANATSSGGLISSLPDMLNSNPATQAEDANKPTLSASSNGLPIMVSAAATFLNLPLIAANNGASQWGIAGWFRSTSTTGSRSPIGIDSVSSGASTRKVRLRQSAGSGALLVDVHSSAGPTTIARRGTCSSTTFTANTWVFVTVELDLDSGGSEASRCVVTVNGSVQTLTFSDLLGTPGSMPPAMAQPTGNGQVCSDANTGGNGFVGELGPNLFFLGSGMPGRTEGLLTAAARTALRNFEAPT